MSLRSKILLNFYFGAMGGFLGWICTESLPGLHQRPATGADLYVLYVEDAIFGAIVGLAIGAFLGLVEGVTVRTLTLAIRGALIGGPVGIVSGVLGLWAGETIYQAMGGGWAESFLEFVWKVIARALGWSLIGLFIGLSEGISTASPQKMKHGAIGGWAGGFLGGAAFDILARIFFTDTLSRLAGLVLIGGFIGFFVGLVEDLLKQAWVKVLSGRNEGKEYILDKEVVVLGRDELADIGLFGDPSVALQHALIRRENNHHVLYDRGNPIGTFVNGQPIQKQRLKDGDTIQIGRLRILFREKAGLQPEKVRVDVASPPAHSARPAAPNICPYCGERKDPISGACACSLAKPLPEALSTLKEPELPQGAAPPASGPCLVGVEGLYRDHHFPIMGSDITIGREMGRDIALLGDTTASRNHARLVLEGGQYVLYDQGSLNGTFVNKERITRAVLQPGDLIHIGGTTFRFQA